MYRVHARSARFTARLLGVATIALFAAAVPSSAQTRWDDDRGDIRGNDYDDDRSVSASYEDPTGWGARFGLGFTVDPTTFLVDLAVPYHLGDGVSVGPRVQVGLDDEDSVVAPTLSLEYAHDLTHQVGAPWNRLRPLVQAGVGFAWIEEDGRSGDDDDAGFLVDVGVGVEYPLNDRFSMASVIDFNILPTEVLDEHLLFTWQVVQLRVNF